MVRGGIRDHQLGLSSNLPEPQFPCLYTQGAGAW